VAFTTLGLPVQRAPGLSGADQEDRVSKPSWMLKKGFGDVFALIPCQQDVGLPASDMMPRKGRR
jgi:hypothetical protein